MVKDEKRSKLVWETPAVRSIPLTDELLRFFKRADDRAPQRPSREKAAAR